MCVGGPNDKPQRSEVFKTVGGLEEDYHMSYFGYHTSTFEIIIFNNWVVYNVLIKTSSRVQIVD